MDAYTLASLLATIAAIVLRRRIVIRVLAIGFLLWIGVQHHLDIRQAERTLMRVDVSSTSQEVAPPELDPYEIVRLLHRTPAGFVAFLCVAALALIPPGRIHDVSKPDAENERAT